MKQRESHYIVKSIAYTFVVAVLFSCSNIYKEVQDLLTDRNMPIGYVENVYHIYTDSGRVQSKMRAPLLLDYKNRENHPYSEFPEGIEVTSFDQYNDSILIKGKYAISYVNTYITEIRDSVEVYKFIDSTKLETTQLYWDQKTNYFYTEKPFLLTTEKDSIFGIGFESNGELENWIMRKTTGTLEVKE